jgi:hypothetical protein
MCTPLLSGLCFRENSSGPSSRQKTVKFILKIKYGGGGGVAAANKSRGVSNLTVVADNSSGRSFEIRTFVSLRCVENVT